MKIVITGGTGFIGRNLKEQLSRQYQILAPTRKELNLLDAERVGEYLKSNHFDIVIHTATFNATRNSTEDITQALQYNQRMFFNLARCGDSYKKMLYFGSGEEYDRRYWIPKMKEGYFDTHVPEDPSGFSKYIITKYIERADNIFNLRCFGVFGKYEDWEIRFISNACCKAVWDLPITVKKNVFFDYLCIGDLVKITDWFIRNRPKEKVYNVCTGKTHDLVTLAKKVLKTSGKDLEIKVAQPGLGTEYSGDNSRLVGEMKQFSFKDIDDSIMELYDWYDANKHDIERELLLRDK